VRPRYPGVQDEFRRAAFLRERERGREREGGGEGGRERKRERESERALLGNNVHDDGRPTPLSPCYCTGEEEEEEESLFKADAVNEEDPERDRATQV